MQNKLTHNGTAKLGSEFQCFGRHWHANEFLKDFPHIINIKIGLAWNVHPSENVIHGIPHFLVKLDKWDFLSHPPLIYKIKEILLSYFHSPCGILTNY